MNSSLAEALRAKGLGAEVKLDPQYHIELEKTGPYDLIVAIAGNRFVVISENLDFEAAALSGRIYSRCCFANTELTAARYPRLQCAICLTGHDWANVEALRPFTVEERRSRFASLYSAATEDETYISVDLELPLLLFLETVLSVIDLDQGPLVNVLLAQEIADMILDFAMSDEARRERWWKPELLKSENA